MRILRILVICSVILLTIGSETRAGQAAPISYITPASVDNTFVAKASPNLKIPFSYSVGVPNVGTFEISGTVNITSWVPFRATIEGSCGFYVFGIGIVTGTFSGIVVQNQRTDGSVYYTVPGYSITINADNTDAEDYLDEMILGLTSQEFSDAITGTIDYNTPK